MDIPCVLVSTYRLIPLLTLTHTNNFGLCIPLPIGGENREEKGTCQNYLLLFSLSLPVASIHVVPSCCNPGGDDDKQPTKQPNNQTTQKGGGGKETKENRTMTLDSGNKFP
jgi:hypothetical protein